MFHAITVLFLVWVAASAVAHTPGACDEEQDREQRLACYDALYPPRSDPIMADKPKPAPVIATMPEAKQSLSPEDQFGEEQLEKRLSTKDHGLSSINSKITSIRKRARQEMEFYLENGQVWLQETPRFRAIKEGFEVTISKANLGGYILTAENGASTKVRRLR